MLGRLRAVRALLGGALALCLGAGCSSLDLHDFDRTSHDEVWVTDQVSAASDRVLLEVLVQALTKEGFPVGTGLDPTRRVAESGWRVDLHPFRGKGYREQAVIRGKALGEGRFDIEVRVRHQTNMDIVRPLDLSYADWKDAPDNEQAAQVLLQLVKSYLGEPYAPGERAAIPGVTGGGR